MTKSKPTSTTTQQPAPTLSDEFEDFSNMSLKNRILGFGMCVILGIFFSAFAYSAIVSGNSKIFTIFYGLTNLIFICGTSFIVGPVRQFKLMFTAERIMSSLIYLTATVAVILTALKVIKKGKMPLAMFLFFVQIMSLIWYTLSYIPYAQEVLSRMIGI